MAGKRRCGFFLELLKLKPSKGRADNHTKLIGIIPGSERANYTERVGRKVSGLRPAGLGSGIAEMLKYSILWGPRIFGPFLFAARSTPSIIV